MLDNVSIGWMYDKYGDTDTMELKGNVLFMTKPLGSSADTGSCGSAFARKKRTV